MTHSNHYGRRQQPSRAATKDSWLTIDWGDRAPPSHLHGILDQIAGTILRDPKLVEQGRTEWRKASAIARDRKRRATRRQNSARTGSSSRGGSGSGSGRSSPKRNASSGPAGFLSSLFGKNNTSSSGSGSGSHKKSSSGHHQPSRSGTLRRAMTTPGRNHQSSGTQVRRRATDGARRR